MTYTTKQLLSFTDDQITELFAPHIEEFLSSWMNTSAHPQALYEWYYEEVVKDSISQKDKDEWLETFSENGHNDMGHVTYELLLSESDYLEEDVAQWFSEEDENISDFIIYTFKYMINDRGVNTLRWITKFMNGE